MKELALLLLCSVAGYTCAARLPYLGGDIQDLLEQAKRSDLLIQKHEKQAPHVAFSEVPIKLRSQEERNRISRLNARARHRNTYFDGAGGNPFNGGGVLSVQNAISRKKHRRRRSAYSYDRPVYGSYYERPTYDRYYYDSDYLLPMMIRQRRGSSMPYLGQNLDTLGVIRAIPRGWAPPQKKSKQTKKDYAAIPDPSLAAYARAAALPGVEMKPALFNSWMSPAFRATIPQPLAMLPPPYAMNYGQVLPNQQNQLYPEFRNMVPSLPSAYYSAMVAAMGQSPLFPSPIRSFMPERRPRAEQPKISTTDNAKKSVIPERPDTNIVSSSTTGANPAGVPDTSTSSFTGSTSPSSLTGSTVPGNSASSYTGSSSSSLSGSMPSINNLLENSAANFARSNIPGDSPPAATSLPGMSVSSYTSSIVPESSPPASNLPGNSASSFARSSLTGRNPASSLTGSNPASNSLPGSAASIFAGGSLAGGSLAGGSLQNNNLPGGTASTMAGSALAGSRVPGSNPAGNTNDEMRWVTPQ